MIGYWKISTIDKLILRQWLKCGFVQHKKLFPTTDGTPQGGVASPTLANMTLDGLENAIKAASNPPDKVNFVRYADDFIVTASSKKHLEKRHSTYYQSVPLEKRS